jgi:hypothetical protein
MAKANKVGDSEAGEEKDANITVTVKTALPIGRI